MKAKFRRTDALLLLPILLLGGVGYWQQQRARKLREPTRIEVRSLQVLPPTPSHVARGFDTRVQLSVGYRGATPRGWGVSGIGISGSPTYALSHISQVSASQPKTSGQKIFSARDIEHHFDTDNDVYAGTYLLQLQQVSSNAPVSLSGAFQANELQQTTRGVTNAMIDTKDLKWNIVVRPKGVKTVVPHVSRYSGLKLKRITLDDRRKGKSSWDFDITVICEIAPALADARPALQRIKPRMDDVYLTDQKNRRFDCRAVTGLLLPFPKNTSTPSNSTMGASFYYWATLPTDTSDLTFHAQISVDDLWPLEINIPIKDIPREP